MSEALAEVVNAALVAVTALALAVGAWTETAHWRRWMMRRMLRGRGRTPGGE